MQIIIVGCGKVGHTLVEQLNGEEHDLVVVDENPDRVREITTNLDAIGIVGNGVNYSTLIEAGIATADLLIAVTGSDEKNLLCCVISKKAGNCKTIARVRNPIYNLEKEFLKNELGLSMIINPEFEAANEISQIFQFPSAIKIDSFAKGRVELLQFRISKDSILNNQKVANIRPDLRCNILICTVSRNDVISIPNGDFILQENDMVGIVAERKEAINFFKKIGIMTNPVQSALIAGGGKISYYLANSLLQAGISTTIIEIDKDCCETLSELLPKANIICGDATDQMVLSEEGLERVQGFAALTNLDEENILLSLYAKGSSNAKTITKINRINFTSVINNLNLDSIIYPRLITASQIIKYVRSLNTEHDSNVENLYKLEDGKAEALEFKIKESSKITDVPLQDLHIKRNILICCIYRNGKVIIPTGQDVLKVNDSVVVVLSEDRILDLTEILEG